MIPHNKPTLGKEEIAASARVLKSGWVAQGEETEKFENDFSVFLSGKSGNAAVVSSGTSALYLALISLGVGSGDEVILPSYVCTAVLNAVFMAGAKPVLVDIGEDLNISYRETVLKINPRTKAIIITHTFGFPSGDMERFLKLKIPVIEDCAQALGSKIKDRYVGTFGDISVFSFYASKMITTGYGGMIFSKNRKIMEKVRDYREFDGRKDYRPRFNFQMSDLQAAIGREQLKKLNGFLKNRKQTASLYSKYIPMIPESARNSNYKPNFYRFVARTDSPRKLQKFLLKNGVRTIVPIEKFELLHNYLGLSREDFPMSEKIAGTSLSLPIYPSLKISEVNRIIKLIGKLAI